MHHSGRIFHWGFLILSLLWAGQAHTGTAHLYVEAVTADLEQALDAPLPDIGDVIPGYRRPSRALPGLVVAHFDTSRADDDLLWGPALSELLRRRLNYAPVTNIYMPSLRWKLVLADLSEPGMMDNDRLRSLHSLTLAHARLGIGQALVGDVHKSTGGFELVLRLLELPSGAIRAEQRFTGNNAELAQQLDAATDWVLAQTGIQLSTGQHAYLARSLPRDYASLVQYARLATLWNQGEQDQARLLAYQLRVREPGFSSVAAALQGLAEPTRDMFSSNQAVRELAEDFPDDTGIQLAGAAAFQHGERVDLGQQRAQWLKDIIRKDPHALMAFLLLADTLAETGLPAEAMAVAVEALKRWPHNYRSWWTFAYVAQRYAWYFRGNKLWIDVPARGKRLFPMLNDIGLRALDQACDMNPDNSRMWVLRMRLLSAWSAEFRKTFDKAVRADPHNAWAYWYGLQFSAPKWSGTLDAQMDVLSQAVENNPGAEWPFRYYRDLIEPGLNMKVWGNYALLRFGCTGSCRTYLPYGLILLALFLVILARLQVVRD